jgi:sialate O-acetylesterase
MKKAAVLCLLVGFLASAQPARITGGVAGNQVFQRGAGDRADIAFEGTAANGPVEARLLLRGVAAPGFDWRPAAKAQDGKWTAMLRGVPVGGPYTLEIRTGGADAADRVAGLLVGDLWVLAGQSNMEGVGDLADVQPPNGMVNSFDQTDRWGIAEEPLHRLVDAADRVHWRRNQQKEPEKLTGEALQKFIADRKKGAGLGLPFAAEMVRRTGVPIGLVACAHGGTSMDQWDPALRDRAGDSLYGATIRRVRLVGGKVKGILWYQGESDANPKAAPVFQQKFERLVAAFRSDFGQPDLPFYYVQIGRYVNTSNVAEWNAVQEMQRKAEAAIPRLGFAPAVDFALDDGIHVGTQDLKRLGARLAGLACHDWFPDNAGCAALKRGPRPVSARFDNGVVRVEFDEVNGGLRAQGRPAGFSIHAPGGEPLAAIYKVRLEANAALLHVQGKLPEGAALWYGNGKDPYCNVRDAADMAMPVFGPLAIQ